MTRYLVTLKSNADRERAAKILAAAPYGARVEIKAAKRSIPQNSRFWAALTDIATQVVWYGKKLPPQDWRYIFLDALKRELRVVPNIDGTGFVNLGRSSSDLTKDEMSQLIELIHAFGAQHNVTFHDSDAAQCAAPSLCTEAPPAATTPQPMAAGNHSRSPAPGDARQAGGGNVERFSAGLPKHKTREVA